MVRIKALPVVAMLKINCPTAVGQFYKPYFFLAFFVLALIFLGAVDFLTTFLQFLG